VGEQVGGTGRLPSIGEGAFFFCASRALAQKLTFLPSFGRAKEKKKVFRDVTLAKMQTLTQPYIQKNQNRNRLKYSGSLFCAWRMYASANAQPLSPGDFDGS
jgi:hypothetical protein